MIGTAASKGLEYYTIFHRTGWADNLKTVNNIAISTIAITLGRASDCFTVSGKSFTDDERIKASQSPAGNEYTYTASGETAAHFLIKADQAKLAHW